MIIRGNYRSDIFRGEKTPFVSFGTFREIHLRNLKSMRRAPVHPRHATAMASSSRTAAWSRRHEILPQRLMALRRPFVRRRPGCGGRRRRPVIGHRHVPVLTAD